MKGVILAGGLGTRLRPFTFFAPKVMLPVGDRTIIERVIEWMANNGIREIIIATGYLHHVIESYLGDGNRLDLDIRLEYVRSKRPMSTGGQLKTVEDKIDGTFLLSYGDVLTNMSLEPVVSLHKKKKATATIVTKKHRFSLRFGVIDIDDEGRVLKWLEKPVIERDVNTGIYLMEPKVFDYIDKGEVISMDVVFRRMLEAGEKIYAYRSKADFIDIGDMESYMEAVEEYTRMLRGI